MQTRFIDRVSDLDHTSWGRLTGGSFYTSPAWLAYQELDADSKTVYAVVLDGETMVAGAPLYLVDREASPRYDPHVAFGPEAVTSPAGRTLLVGNRRGYSNHLCVIDDHRREAAVRALVAAVNDYADEHADGRSWWMYLDEAAAGLLQTHGGAGDAWLQAGDCSIPLPGTSYEDYLQSRTKNQRNQIKGDRRKFRSAGYQVEHRRLEDCWQDAAPLIASHQRRHGHDQSDSSIGALLREQASVANHASSVLLCRQGPRVLGCGLAFTAESHVTSRAFGYTAESANDAAEYFELLFYRPIERAYELQVPAVHLGIGTLAAKVRRGADVQLRWAVAIDNRNPIGAPPGHNTKVRDTVLTELDGSVAALTTGSRHWVERAEECVVVA